ncbi:MAG: cell division protein FtsQ/DivIB [Cocleimonas sp.]
MRVSNTRQKTNTRQKAKRPQATRRNQPRPSLSARFSLPWKTIALTVLVIAPIAVAIGTYQWIQNPQNLTITSVEVKGDLNILDKSQLQPVIEPFTKTNLYLLDEKALETAIENNPWVHSASMTKIWPDKLIVKIHEQRPVAFWGDKEMLAENGEIIKANLPKEKGNLPLLYSPNDKGRNMATGFLKIRKWMKDFPLKMVEFKEDARGSWQIKLQNDMVLKIGREHQEKRLRRFMVGYDHSLKQVINDVKAVDLRYTNGFAVKWKKGRSGKSRNVTKG